MIGRVFLDGSHAHPLQTWESALPVKVQKLSRKYFFSGRPDFRTGSGLVKFRWPVVENGKWRYLPAKEHPFYSEEQYTEAFYQGYADFVEAVAQRIDPTPYTPEKKFVKVLETLSRYLKERVSIVLEGNSQCRHGSCPQGSEGWEVYNTKGRDEMIASLIHHLSEIIDSNRLDQVEAKRRMMAISIDISENRSISLFEAYQNHLWFSPHPSDSIEARWGLKKCEMIHAKTRAANHSIAFIEKTYRKKDPRYADFSIQQQRHLLTRLNEEWRKSGCQEPFPSLKKIEARLPQPKEVIKPRFEPKRCEKIRGEICATHDSVAFIEKTYGKKDPEYADFSIRQQQHLLKGLVEEWKSVGCRGDPP